MILIAAAARQAKSQILAASSTWDEPVWPQLLGTDKPFSECWIRSERKNAQNPIKQSKTHAKPPTLEFVGAPAKVSAKMANAMAGKGR